LGFITTTTPKTIAVIKEGLTNYINFDDFDLITSDECVNLQKPNPEAYEYALRKLEISASEAVAVEDTKTNQSAASLCGIDSYLFPGEFATIDYRDMAEERFIPEMLELSKLLD
jgi:FMN phosphatase YigB (HAD superfamily)